MIPKSLRFELKALISEHIDTCKEPSCIDCLNLTHAALKKKLEDDGD